MDVGVSALADGVAERLDGLHISLFDGVYLIFTN